MFWHNCFLSHLTLILGLVYFCFSHYFIGFYQIIYFYLSIDKNNYFIHWLVIRMRFISVSLVLSLIHIQMCIRDSVTSMSCASDVRSDPSITSTTRVETLPVVSQGFNNPGWRQIVYTKQLKLINIVVQRSSL